MGGCANAVYCRDEEHCHVCHFENFSPEVSPYLSKQFKELFHLGLIHSTRRRYISATKTRRGICHCSTLHNVVFQHCVLCIFVVSAGKGGGWDIIKTGRMAGVFRMILSMRVPLTVDHCSAWQAGRASSLLICAWGGQAGRPGLRYRGVDDVKWHSVSSHKTTARRRPALPGTMHNSTTMQYPPSQRRNISTSSYSPNPLQPLSDINHEPGSCFTGTDVHTYIHQTHANMISLLQWLMKYRNWKSLVRHWPHVVCVPGKKVVYFAPVNHIL